MSSDVIGKFLKENSMKLKQGIGFPELEKKLEVMLGNDEQMQILEQAMTIVEMVEMEITPATEVDVLSTYAAYLKDEDMFPKEISNQIVSFLSELWIYGEKLKLFV